MQQAQVSLAVEDGCTQGDVLCLMLWNNKQRIKNTEVFTILHQPEV